MIELTIQIPDDLARGLEAIAVAQKKSVEQVALDRLQYGLTRPDSPESLLRAVRELRRPSAAAVAELDSSIATANLPVRENGAFDGWPVG